MDNVAMAIAKTILNGFERHIFLFFQLTQTAKQRFEQRQWHAVQEAARARTDYYDQRIKETLDTLCNDFHISTLNEAQWQRVKEIFVTLIYQHPQAELAESFYNSVFCHLFDRKYYHNDFIFVESALTTLPPSHDELIYTRYHPASLGLWQTLNTIISNAEFSVNFHQRKKRLNQLIQAFAKQTHLSKYSLTDLAIDILKFTFYRNKGAYIIGRVLCPDGAIPFIVPITHETEHGLVIDALITDARTMAIVFGFARAYFFVDCHYPAALINFLKALIPHKTKADLYASIGFHKQGKTQFYRDLLAHLANSADQFELAPGIKGMVMAVFTLPSFPYVFKLIKDKFSPSKQITRDDVKAKYRLVKLHDRVGRMADTLEYSEVALPKARFSPELLDELLSVAPSIISFDEELVIINHVYIERKMTPLNLYLASANEQEINKAMYGYGKAIKQLIAANIFPGDMLLKNFGVTRHGRVIFYDYDEITYLKDINFRTKPQPKTEEQIYAAEPWYSVAPGDVFPEELATFALANQRYRQAFLRHHGELLDASYWQNCQQLIAQGEVANVYPYPSRLRFK